MNPLAGRRVVITRTSDQAGPTAEAVASFEAVPVLVPLIDIVDEPAGMAELRSFELGGVDWVVVTSPNGAQRVAPLLPRRPAGRPQVAAVGSTTAAALPYCDLVATTQSAAGLLDVFPDGPGRVAVVQAVDAASTLVDGLVVRRWDVVAIKAYRAVTAQPTDAQRQAALDADALLLASGSAARAWAQVFGRRTPAVVVAIGAQTAAAAQDAGLKISVISADHSVHGMLVTLSRYFSDAN